MPLTAIVLGASGLVGRALVDQLAASPDYEKIITLTRRASPHPSTKVENRVINFEQLAQSAESLRGDRLFSCLGTTLKRAGSVEAQRTVDLTYQLEVARLAARNGVPHYLLVSSSGANAKSRSAYLKMKGDLEEAVTQLPFERISIFQPSLLLGQRDHFRFGETLGSWVLPLLCKLPGLHRYRPIEAEQVARKMLGVSTRAGSGVETFTLDEIF
ncbi:NAD-dependent epimerase/dehydratase family protein [Biformimicrobium ophioploci]|uniref:Oxidoreductase n=1 Tax=Biformimicrobium ophioploci TaxID=3036711 RepID=A0ABQ6M0P1_9GAMM|nr:NAD-dependent epimerase/dehydratase family protein [Microbulbifer sp. NKW57]GMG87845.1 oxidoreductase [Microbulbifer sp. NKW57]